MRLKFYSEVQKNLLVELILKLFLLQDLGSYSPMLVTYASKLLASSFAVKATRRQVSDEARRTRRNSNEDTSLIAERSFIDYMVFCFGKIYSSFLFRRLSGDVNFMLVHFYTVFVSTYFRTSPSVFFVRGVFFFCL